MRTSAAASAADRACRCQAKFALSPLRLWQPACQELPYRQALRCRRSTMQAKGVSVCALRQEVESQKPSTGLNGNSRGNGHLDNAPFEVNIWRVCEAASRMACVQDNPNNASEYDQPIADRWLLKRQQRMQLRTLRILKSPLWTGS